MCMRMLFFSERNTLPLHLIKSTTTKKGKKKTSRALHTLIYHLNNLLEVKTYSGHNFFNLRLAFQFSKYSFKQYKEIMKLLSSSVIFYQTCEILIFHYQNFFVYVVITS